MSFALPETDQQRRAFAGYIAAVITVVMVANKVVSAVKYDSLRNMQTFGGFESSTGWLDRIVDAASGNQLIGLLLVAAAFLLMLDSDDEPLAMKIGIAATAIVGVILMLVSVIGAGDAVLNGDSNVLTNNSVMLHDLLDYGSGFVFGLAALAMTWEAVTSLNVTAAGDDTDLDTAGNTEPGTTDTRDGEH